jgi:hypothetical protein
LEIRSPALPRKGSFTGCRIFAKDMAQRRLISPTIVESDAFLDMPVSSQALYFHLCMNADDDGFVNPKKIMRLIGAAADDLNVLLAKRFALKFENGVVVIKHWLIHNTIRKDRYHETIYTEEKAMLQIKENGAYTELATKWQPNGNLSAPEVKVSKVKPSEVKREDTPHETSSRFFSEEDNDEQRATISLLVENGVPEQIARAEIKKFVAYWTEKNQIGTKQRWEQEKTFEIKRRLNTWFQKANQFSGGQKNKVISII